MAEASYATIGGKHGPRCPNVVCETCGLWFHERPSRLKRKHHFCKKSHVNYSVVAKGINQGEKNGMWHGGKTITNRGYKKVLVPLHPRADRDGYVLEHIVVMEKHLHRYLQTGEVVHHIDFNKLNNSIGNLMLFPTHSAHRKYESQKGGKRNE